MHKKTAWKLSFQAVLILTILFFFIQKGQKKGKFE
jgi:hypothetical protein